MISPVTLRTATRRCRISGSDRPRSRRKGGSPWQWRPSDNGVNVQALLDAREALKGAPEAAQFTWRASSKWENGVHSTDDGPELLRPRRGADAQDRDDVRRRPPGVFAAEDNGITPIEYLLVGLASCLTAGVASVAQNRGIQLRSVESTVEGNDDIQRDPRRRQRRAQRLRRHQGDLRHRRRRVARRTSRRWSPSRRSARPSSTPSRTRRTSPSRSPEGQAIEQLHHGRHRRRPRRPRGQPLPHRAVDRPRRPRARRGGELLAPRALGLAAAADAQLAEPAAGPSLRRPGSRRLHDDARGGRLHRALRRRVSRAPVRTSTTVTSVRARPTTAIASRRADGEIRCRARRARERRLQPADGAGGQRGACRRTSSRSRRSTTAIRPSCPTAACSSSARRRPACSSPTRSAARAGR